MNNIEKKEKRGILQVLRDTKGMSTVEYAILLAVIAAVAFTTWQTFGEKVENSIGESTNTLDI